MLNISQFKKKTPANKTEQVVQFRHKDAQRIASAVHAHETARRGRNPSTLPRAAGGGGISLRVGKTTATWTKGTVATIPLWEEGTPPNETESNSSLEGCVNKWADVAGDKWVGMMRGPGGVHYLVVAEC